MIEDPFIAALVELILFLELSEPQVVDEDAAMKMLERVADILQSLGPHDRKRFCEAISVRARDTVDAAQRRVLSTLADDLGLTPG